ncbi:MAG: helix-turn-helix transcriptional regulator [Deltaproteobacteria bacterium]|nr:helix-turn-helix transcriptional regulator [Deltaproteobacteria bacterium]
MTTPALIAATASQFRRRPAGRFVAHATSVHFCVEPTLWGLVLWGRPTEQDALTLGRSLVFELDKRTPPHRSLVDASRLEGGDEGAFSLLQRYLTESAAELSRAVTRLALIRPDGMRGALVAGAYQVVKSPYPVQVFDDLLAGLAWLDAREAHEVIADMTRSVLGAPHEVTALRAFLDAHLDAALADAARALAISERSLQRRLAEAGVTFQAEQADARVRVAQRLLADSDAALTTVALEVGCASLQHFNALFRRRTGLSPSAWRARARRRGAAPP